MGYHVNNTVSTTTEDEANRPMPKISPESVESLSENTYCPPWVESITIGSRSFSLDAVEFQSENFMQHPSESLDVRRSDDHVGTGFSSDDEGFFRKGSISSRRSFVDATKLEKPEKSTQYLSKSYGDRYKEPEKHRQYLSKSYDFRLNAKNEKFVASNNKNFLPRTISGSDCEDPPRQRSKSSLADPVRIKGPPMKCDQKRQEPFASGAPVTLDSFVDFEDDFRRIPSLSTLDATTAEQIYHEKDPSKSNAEREGRIHESQNWGENHPAEGLALFLPNTNKVYSKARREGAAEKRKSERRVGIFLAQHSDLEPLYEEALRRMDKDRFVTSIRRLLKKYHLDLSQDVINDSDRAMSQLLQGRAGRIRIARYIADKFNSEYNEIQAQIGQHLHETRSEILDLGAWITGNADSESHSKAAKSEALNNILTSDDEILDDEKNGEENKYRGLLLNTVKIEKILTRGRPFQNLSMNLEVLALPATLDPFTRLLMSIPNDRIWFSKENDISLLNRLKTFVEDHTEENWNWWLLQQRMRVLKINQTRMHWRCHCDTHLWAEISIPDAKSCQSFLRRRKTLYQHNHLCRIRRHGNSSMKISLAGILQAAGSAIQPGRWYGSSRSSSATLPQATPHKGVIGPSQASINTQLFLQRTGTSNQPAAQTSISMPHINESFVLFGVKGTRRTFELAQINARKCMNDDVFFGDMRKRYRELRGFSRYWFSIWRFSHCDFVKFEKIRANRIIPRGKEIPTDMNYEYKPRPPHAEDPPISPHEFELAFSSCAIPCVFSAFHDCIEAPNGDFAMERIPKRKSALQLETGMVEFAWGIQAQHAVSLVNLVIYHFLILAGTFAFWAWWQTRHPDDMQNAAVPLTTVAVLLSMFWSSAGLLKIFR